MPRDSPPFPAFPREVESGLHLNAVQEVHDGIWITNAVGLASRDSILRVKPNLIITVGQEFRQTGLPPSIRDFFAKDPLTLGASASLDELVPKDILEKDYLAFGRPSTSEKLGDLVHGIEANRIQHEGQSTQNGLVLGSIDGNSCAYYNAGKIYEEDENKIFLEQCDLEEKDPNGPPEDCAEVKALECLDETVRIMEQRMGDCTGCRPEGASCLIVCASGCNKSVMVACAFINRFRHLPLVEAFEAIWQIRPGVWLTPYLMRLCSIYEASLFRNVVRRGKGLMQSLAGGSRNNEALLQQMAHQFQADVPSVDLQEYTAITEQHRHILDPIRELERSFFVSVFERFSQPPPGESRVVGVENKPKQSSSSSSSSQSTSTTREESKTEVARAVVDHDKGKATVQLGQHNKMLKLDGAHQNVNKEPVVLLSDHGMLPKGGQDFICGPRDTSTTPESVVSTSYPTSGILDTGVGAEETSPPSQGNYSR